MKDSKRSAHRIIFSPFSTLSQYKLHGFYGLSAKAARKSIALLKSAVEVGQDPGEKYLSLVFYKVFVLLLGNRTTNSKLL